MIMILKYILTNKSKKVRKSINVTHGFVSILMYNLKQEKKIFNLIKLVIKTIIIINLMYYLTIVLF